MIMPINIREDVPYGYAGRTLLADVFRPDPDHDLGIGLVHVHGGAWRRGDRKMLQHMSERLSALGYTVVAPEYRFIEEAAWPASLHDVKAAVRWTRDHAEEFGIDPTQIVLEGHSSGGQLSLMCAGTQNDPAWEGESGTPGVATDVAAVAAVYPVSQFYIEAPDQPRLTYPLPAADGSMPAYLLLEGEYDEETARRASPVAYAGPDFPPTMFWLGGDDGYTPAEGSFPMYRILRDAGVTVDLHIIGEAPHGFDLTPAYGEELQIAADQFFRRMLREREDRQAAIRARLPEGMWSRTRSEWSRFVGEGKPLFEAPGLPTLAMNPDADAAWAGAPTRLRARPQRGSGKATTTRRSRLLQRREPMRLGYFAMPFHPEHRDWRETLEEDRKAIILADRLGFHDAFIGEHLTDRSENVTNSMLFLATLIGDTNTILLGTGTSNLSHTHPALIAANAAMFDHLSGGRFILGVSPGALPSDAELLGILDENRNAIFADAIDVITELWEREPPYDIGGPESRFHVTTRRTLDRELALGAVHRPLQQPRPEIVGTVVAPYSRGVVPMGARDFHPLSANFLLPQWVATHWPNYVQGAESAGRIPDRSEWRVARTVFVADSEATAAAYGQDDPSSPYRLYYDKMLRKMSMGGRLNLFKQDQEHPDSSVTLDGTLDALVITGTSECVAEQIVQLHRDLGGFGELVYAGMDWSDEQLARRSMELMATEVLPAVNAELRATSAEAVAGPAEAVR
jgi:alkanesulfonate monooxygenase SsuD/methylene tetrahydromethanopterin reductase-like flavin-dependent oxidoreductase (luciferase family)/acetyl esterase/lipase